MAQQTLLNGVPFLEQRQKINSNFTELYGLSSGMSAFFVDGSGNVGIGAAPSVRFDVKGIASGNTYLRTRNDAATSGFDVGVGSGGVAAIYNRNNTSLIFGTNNQTRLTLDNVGNLVQNVGGALITGGNLTIRSPDGAEGGQITLYNRANTVGTFNVDVDNADHCRIFTVSNNTNMTIGQLVGTGGNVTIHTGATERFRVSPTGNVGIGIDPAYKLDVNGAFRVGSLGKLTINNDGTNASFVNSLGNFLHYTPAASSYIWHIDGVNSMSLTGAGKLIVGTGTIGDQKARIYNAVTNPIASQTNLLVDGSMTITADSAFSHGSQFSSYVNHGTYNATASMGNGGVCNLKSYVYATGTGGVVTALAGFYADVRNVGSGTVAGLAGLSVKFVNSGGGTVSNVYGVFMPDSSISTNTYGFYSGVSSGTNKYGIYCIGTADNYLNGKTTVNAEFKPKSITETIFAITDGASVDLNPLNGGIQTWTLGASRSPTATTFADGQSMTLSIDDGTAYTITWPSVTWVGGSAPTLATTGKTWIELFKVNGVLYGALVGTTA